MFLMGREQHPLSVPRRIPSEKLFASFLIHSSLRPVLPAQVVVFTASLSKYADPLLDLLDPHQTIRHRLFREHCCPYEGNYVKVRHASTPVTSA
jgi:hypothetical protein